MFKYSQWLPVRTPTKPGTSGECSAWGDWIKTSGWGDEFLKSTGEKNTFELKLPCWMTFFSEDHDLPTKVNLFPSLVLKICRSWASVLKLVTRCGAWPGWFHHNKILICTSRSTRVPHIFGGWPGTPSQCDQGPRHVFGGGPWQRAWSLHHQGGLSRLGLAQKSWIDPKHHRYWYMIIWYVSVYIYVIYVIYVIYDIAIQPIWCVFENWGFTPKTFAFLYRENEVLNHFGWNEVPYFQVQNPRD